MAEIGKPFIRLPDNRCRRIAIGFPMKIGLTCIAYDKGRHVVFAVQAGAFEPYVTWKYDCKEDEGEPEYVFWAGHYFQSIINATRDYVERP